MICRNTITLLLAFVPALLAVPTKTLDRRGLPEAAIKAASQDQCDLSHLTMPTAPTPLPSPAAGLRLAHVAIGHGTQNYTCKGLPASAAPSAVGAKADLLNATCTAVRAPAVFQNAARIALQYEEGTAASDVKAQASAIEQLFLSGHHFFNDAGVPLFTLDTHNWGYLLAKKNASSPAPANAEKGKNGRGSVPWLRLTATAGDYQEVFRLNTAGGQPPATCDGISGDFTVPYAAEYWIWK